MKSILSSYFSKISYDQDARLIWYCTTVWLNLYPKLSTSHFRFLPPPPPLSFQLSNVHRVWLTHLQFFVPFTPSPNRRFRTYNVEKQNKRTVNFTRKKFFQATVPHFYLNITDTMYMAGLKIKQRGWWREETESRAVNCWQPRLSWRRYWYLWHHRLLDWALMIHSAPTLCYRCRRGTYHYFPTVWESNHHRKIHLR